MTVENGEPLSYHHVENAMRSSINWVREYTKQFSEACDAYAKANADYEVGFASTRLRVKAYGYTAVDPATEEKKFFPKPSDDMAKDVAITENKDLLRESLIKKAVLDAARQRMLSEREKLEGLRSLMSSYRGIE